MTKQELEYGKILLSIEDLEIGFEEFLQGNPNEEMVKSAKATMEGLAAFRQKVYDNLNIIEESELMEKLIDYLDLPQTLYWALRNKGYLKVKDLVNEKRNTLFLYLGAGSYQVLRMRMVLKGIPSNDKNVI